MQRTGGRIARAVGAATLVALSVAATGPTSAKADVVSPAGACVGSGTWVNSGLNETSTSHQPKDVIVVPRADTVRWAGNEKGFALGALGPRRDIDGAVQLKLPIGLATIDTWGGSSQRYANQGEHTYDLPKALAGVKLKLKGFHKENGKLVCSGSVYVKIKGTSPLKPIAVAGLVLSGAVLLLAGKPVFRKTAPAFEDINRG